MTNLSSSYTAAELARIDRARGAKTRGKWQHDATMAAAPVPPFNPTPTPTPVPVPTPAGTWYEHIGISITGASSSDVATLLKYGRWCRTGREDCWDPNQFKAFMVEAHRQGLKVLSCIQACDEGSGRYANWSAARYAQFGDYALQIADLGVDVIEAGNECNHVPFNAATDAAQTVARSLAKVTAARVHATHPTIQVITGGWSPEGGGPPEQYPQTAMKTIVNDPALVAAVDGYSTHPYENTMRPSDVSTNPAWNAAYWVRDEWASIVAKGGSKPLYLTEFGYRGGDADQETWMRDYFALWDTYRAGGMKIPAVFWHTLRENESTTSADENSMGILRGGSEKPSAVALREIGKRSYA